MQRYFSKEKKDNKFILEDSDLYHIKTVMRMHDLEKIEVVYAQKLYICCIENVNSDITITMLNEVKNDYKKSLNITLIIPLLKEQKFDFVLQKATELGVNEIIPIITERSIIKVKNVEEEKKLIRWTKILKEASEQSKRIDIPIIRRVSSIKDLGKIGGLKLICSTSEKSKTIKNILKNNQMYDKISFVVGPEGGLTNKEEESLQKQNFIPITLGNKIMRVETVPIFLMSVINYENME